MAEMPFLDKYWARESRCILLIISDDYLIDSLSLCIAACK